MRIHGTANKNEVVLSALILSFEALNSINILITQLNFVNQTSQREIEANYFVNQAWRMECSWYFTQAIRKSLDAANE